MTTMTKVPLDTPITITKDMAEELIHICGDSRILWLLRQDEFSDKYDAESCAESIATAMEVASQLRNLIEDLYEA